MGLTCESENDADCIVSVIKELHHYVPHGQNGDGTEEQGIVGDQLTVERFVNGHTSIANGFTKKDQCTGFHAEVCRLAFWE